MIAVDASALVCIALQESDAIHFVRIISQYDCLLGGPTLLEAHLVLRGRSKYPPFMVLDRIIDRPNVEVVDFTTRHVALAREAFDRFGRGRHVAALNYGDCMSYAIAKHASVPLLFKGDDFARTDIASVEKHS